MQIGASTPCANQECQEGLHANNLHQGDVWIFQFEFGARRSLPEGTNTDQHITDPDLVLGLWLDRVR